VLLAIMAHALLHREHRRRANSGEIIATIAQDYTAVRKLMADLLAQAAETKARQAVLETADAVAELNKDSDGVLARAVADKLGRPRGGGCARR
jgi:hypothetical protein